VTAHRVGTREDGLPHHNAWLRRHDAYDD